MSVSDPPPPPTSHILSVSSLVPRLLCVRLVAVLALGALGVLAVPWVPIFLTLIMQGPLVEHRSKCTPLKPKCLGETNMNQFV